MCIRDRVERLLEVLRLRAPEGQLLVLRVEGGGVASAEREPLLDVYKRQEPRRAACACAACPCWRRTS